LTRWRQGAQAEADWRALAREHDAGRGEGLAGALCCHDLAVPANLSLLFLPPYAPELNPKENLWDEIREKIFENHALRSIDAVHRKLNEAILNIERNPRLVKSIT
jgi:DDE superfamily endonuclease